MSKKEIEELWRKWCDLTETLDDLGEIVNIKNVYPTIMIDVKDDDERWYVK